MVAGKRRASGGLLDLLFGRKSKKYAQRQENVSSRYLDSGAEEAILGRSLLQKSNGDEFLRCTEFDKEGSQLLHLTIFIPILTVMVIIQETLLSYLENSKRVNFAQRFVPNRLLFYILES